MLYMGLRSASSVAFAFAIAALLGAISRAQWAAGCARGRPPAWSFLTLGIMLGSLWAYYVLGWAAGVLGPGGERVVHARGSPALR
jgi:cytochrome c-type biogenesis protein CcmF